MNEKTLIQQPLSETVPFFATSSNLFYNKADLVVHPPSAKEFHAQLHVHLVLVVHDVDHVPLDLHQHLLGP